MSGKYTRWGIAILASTLTACSGPTEGAQLTATVTTTDSDEVAQNIYEVPSPTPPHEPATQFGVGQAEGPLEIGVAIAPGLWIGTPVGGPNANTPMGCSVMTFADYPIDYDNWETTDAHMSMFGKPLSYRIPTIGGVVLGGDCVWTWIAP